MRRRLLRGGLALFLILSILFILSSISQQPHIPSPFAAFASFRSNPLPSARQGQTSACSRPVCRLEHVLDRLTDELRAVHAPLRGFISEPQAQLFGHFDRQCSHFTPPSVLSMRHYGITTRVFRQACLNSRSRADASKCDAKRGKDSAPASLETRSRGEDLKSSPPASLPSPRRRCANLAQGGSLDICALGKFRKPPPCAKFAQHFGLEFSPPHQTLLQCEYDLILASDVMIVAFSSRAVATMIWSAGSS